MYLVYIFIYLQEWGSATSFSASFLFSLFMLEIVFKGLPVFIPTGKKLGSYRSHPHNMKKVNQLKKPMKFLGLLEN